MQPVQHLSTSIHLPYMQTMYITIKHKMSQHNSTVDIGFGEKCDPNYLTSAHFPSKIGSKPAWLSYSNLPTYKDLQCPVCSKQFVFLCQIYAPYEEDDDNFHRTIFIFMCRNSHCSVRNNSMNILALRSSLPRKNEFYSYEPPKYCDTPLVFDYKKFGVNFCCCGCLATLACCVCRKVYYCCKDHQVFDWRVHKQYCSKLATNEPIEKHEFNWSQLYPEYEIVIEPEQIQIEGEPKIEKEIEDLHISGTMQDVAEEDLQSACFNVEDKQFNKFQKRISLDKEQLIRFERDGQPLYIAEEPKVSEVPKCQYCGGERQFEFQLMPQMLYVIEEIEVDFGIIAIYTCKKSCTENGEYKKEYVFKQDVTELNF